MPGARPLLPFVLAGFLTTTFACSVFAADEPAEKPGETPTEKTPADKSTPSDKPVIGELLKRLEKVEAEASRLHGGAGPAVAPRNRKLAGVLETIYLGTTYLGTDEPNRFLVARLTLINQGSEALTIRREQITLNADGTTLPLVEPTRQLQFQSFRSGKRNYTLGELTPAKELRVAPSGTDSTWLVFSNIPGGMQIPKLLLAIDVPGEKVEINVNDFALGQLGLSVEKIGPRNCLALLTISGEVNSVNVGGLIDTLATLTMQKIGRAVIRWTSDAPPVDGLTANWFRQAAFDAGRSETRENRMPVVPAAIRELHLAGLPSERITPSDSSEPIQPRLHKTDREAVRAALESAYAILPIDELRKEIDQGHPLTRAAALACGGGRLPVDDLPLILKYADDSDSAMQLAALEALQNFGEKPAIDKLVEVTRRNSEPTASAAIESLAASRFAAAHQALLEILKNQPPNSKKLIVSILARHPRPLWSETIYEYVSHPDASLSAEALRALANVGHPKLLELLAQTLERDKDPLREEAFDLLLSRSDRESEELAMNYTLKFLEKEPPTEKMSTLLRLTKDPRAVPLLLKHLDGDRKQRVSIINLLGQIGDQSVAESLATKYPKFSGREKGAVLNALQQLKSPDFRKLAAEALTSSEPSAMSSAVNGLQNDGGVDAIRLLIDALDKSTEKTSNRTLAELSNALGTLGTKEAQEALRRARDTGHEQKRRAALEALNNIWQRSPGISYVYGAMHAEQSSNWKEAVTNYGNAIELDPELPMAYSGRGHSMLMLNKPQEAQTDFKKAIELDPFNSIAVTGLAITQVLEGKIDDGLKSVENVRKKFGKDQLYFYNTACVYGRAVEALKKADGNDPARDKKLDECRKKAIEDLRKSMKLGFNQLDWMKKDPDLTSLHDLPEFQKLASGDLKALDDGGQKDQQDEKKTTPEDPPADTPSNDSPFDSDPQTEEEESLQPEIPNPEQVQADIDFFEAMP